LELPAIEMEVDAGEYRAALGRLDRVIAAMPQPATYLHRRGQVLLQAGCGDEARSSYEKALAAVAEIPQRRRQTRAVADLEARIRADLEALPPTSAPCGLMEIPIID
jgi:Flp pilus assembly protein TadD